MNYRYDYGDSVRVIRNVRNDGTFAGKPTGELLIRRGSIGFVRDVGTFLQDQVIYSVHFLDADRVVGCREEELIAADAPWNPSRFEFREHVRTLKTLRIGEQTVAAAGCEGQVVKVLSGEGSETRYHVLFKDRVFLVPESALTTVSEPSP